MTPLTLNPSSLGSGEGVDEVCTSGQNRDGSKVILPIFTRLFIVVSFIRVYMDLNMRSILYLEDEVKRFDFDDLNLGRDRGRFD